MSDAEVKSVFDLVKAEKPEKEEEFRQSYERALAEFEKDGFCRGYGDWRRDVNGIAVPVYSLNGTRVYGFNVGGPSFHVKKKQLENYYAKHLKEAAKILNCGG